MNYIYILECSDGTLYTGWTNNLENRILNHNTKRGAKYTKNRLPAYIRYYEEYEEKIDAMKREWQIKQLKKNDKNKLISVTNSLHEERMKNINLEIELMKKLNDNQ